MVALDGEFDADDVLAETEVDADEGPAPMPSPGNQDMAAINLIENERNMHMIPAPQAPFCC